MNDPDKLAELADLDLEQRARALATEMGPLEEALARLRVQLQQVSTEQRKRERARHLRARMQVRTTVAEGQLPSLQQVTESLNDLVDPQLPLSSLSFFRDSGTALGLGYATGREQTVWMTNGSSTLALKTIADIRSRYAQGWDFGTVAHPGVRIYLPNSRTEKILQPSEIFVSIQKR